MSEEMNTAAAIIRDARPVEAITVGGVPALVIPPNFQEKLYPELLLAPQRTKKNVVAHDVKGFIDYVNRFKISDVTAIFAALEPAPRLVSVIDYHAPNAPAHCEHNVSCAMAHSVEWKRWTEKDRKFMGQKEFGEFLEDNLKDVVTPAGPELLQMALNFSSFRSVEFKSAQRLQDSKVQFQYLESDKAGEIQMPDKIKLALPVFRGGSISYAITARLKFTLQDTKLQLKYELERHDLVLDAAYSEVIAAVATDTGIQVFRGAC